MFNDHDRSVDTGTPIHYRTDPIGMVRWDADGADRWRAEGYWRDATLADLTRAGLGKNRDRVAIIEGLSELSVGRIWGEANSLARGLLARGIGPGVVLSYQLPNWYEASVINLAAAMIGAVVNPLVPMYREAELRFMLADIGTRIVFVPNTFRGHDYAEMLTRVAASLDHEIEIVVLRGRRAGCLAYLDLVNNSSGDLSLPPVDPDSVYVMMHTSGTTGRPKCVLHSHNSFLVQARVHSDELNGPAPNVLIVATPISHIAGIILVNIYALLSDTPVVLMESWSAPDAVDLIKRHGCTSLGGATPFLQQLLDEAQRQGEQLPMLTRLPVGGAAVPPDLIRDAQDWFPNAVSFRIYGCTEVPTVTSGSAGRQDIANGADTDGQVRHVDVRIVDVVTGAPLPAGEDGEILLRGPQMMLGYLREADNLDAFDSSGFFRTGDIGRFVNEDYLLITGRKKDLIIRQGENLSPKEIEDALHAHPGVAAAAVVGMPSAKTGECVCAFVVAHCGATVTLSELDTFLTDAGLSRRKVPERLVIVDALPISPQGKVLKQVLRERALLMATEQ